MSDSPIPEWRREANEEAAKALMSLAVELDADGHPAKAAIFREQAAEIVARCARDYFPGPQDTVEAAGQDGFDAGTQFIMAEARCLPIPEGCRFADNPHPEHTDEWRAWADNWDEAISK